MSIERLLAKESNARQIAPKVHTQLVTCHLLLQGERAERIVSTAHSLYEQCLGR